MEDDKHVNFSSEDDEIKDNQELKDDEYVDNKAEESGDVVDSSEEDEAPENNNYQIDGKFTVDDEEIEFFDDDGDKKRDRPLNTYHGIDRNERPSKKKKLTRLVKKTNVDEDNFDDLPPEEENNDEEEDSDDRFVVGKKPSRMDYREPEVNTNIYKLGDYFGNDSEEDIQYNEEDEEAEVNNKTDIELLREHFEPDVLKENFLTREDQLIKEIDVPERYLLRDQILEKQMGEKRQEITTEEFTDEAKWIASRINPFQDNEEFNEKIEKVLYYMYIKNEDIPYIFQYHKDDLYPEITDYKTLWSIYDFDEKWILLSHKKRNYYKVIAMLENENEEREDITKMLEYLNDCQTEEEVEDIFSNFQFMYGEEIADFKENSEKKKNRETEEDEISFYNNPNSNPSSSIKKRPQKKSFYEKCKKEGYVKVASLFGLSASEFGQNLLKGYDYLAPRDDPSEPIKFIQSKFPHLLNYDVALQKSRKLLSLCIFNDPRVRKHFRSIYHEFSYISTIPTNKGKKEIDAFHIYYNVKRLEKKPIGLFKNSMQWLEILNAEKEELIKVEIKIQREQRLEKFEELYLSKDFSSHSQLWNDQRKIIFADALLLIESYFQNEIRNKLKLQANSYLIDQCTIELEKRITILPFETQKRKNNNSNNNNIDDPNNNDPNNDPNNPNNNNINNVHGNTDSFYNTNQNIVDLEEDEERRGSKVVDKRFTVLSISIDNEDDNKGIVCALLDVNGELKHFFNLQFFITRTEPNSLNAKRKSQERKTFSEFIVQHKPSVIGIGACLGGKKAKDVMREMEELKKEINRAYISEKLGGIEIMWINGEASRILSQSSAEGKKGGGGSEGLSEYSTMERMAISLGRMIQNPLSEISNLWNGRDEILCLQLHPLQSSLPPIALKKQLERKFVEVVNHVGVDINQLLRFPHHRNKMKFISGLGDRKLNQLFISLSGSGGKILKRSEMAHYLSKNLYLNSIAFIKIGPLYLPKKDEHAVDCLDATRIHPSLYPLARRFAYYLVDGKMGLHDEENTSNSNDLFSSIFPKLFRDPIKYFKKNDPLVFINKDFNNKFTLEDIRNEFSHPFLYSRQLFVRFRNPTDSELFTWLTGENDITLHRGQSVDAKISSIGKNKQVMCWLPNGMQGVIPFMYISDQRPESQREVEKMIKIGMNVKARVLDVKKSDLRVNLTTRAKDLKKDIWEREYIKEHKFDPNLIHDNSTNNALDLPPPPPIPRISSIQPNSTLGTLLKGNDFNSDVFGDNNSNNNNNSESINFSRPHLVSSKKPLQNRIVDHPLFKNIDYQKTIEELEGKPIGTVVIRPSSKGNDHLTISWRFTEKMIVHVDVKEEKKSELTPLSIGKQLIIASNSYEDLDEILANYLDPIVLYCQEVFNHRKFNPSPSNMIEDFLLKEKEKTPSSIPYCIVINEKHPGYFDVCYLPNKRVHHESFSVHPEGYKFRKKNFTNPSKLLDYFKHHYKEASQQSLMKHSTPTSVLQNKRQYPSSNPSNSRPRGNYPRNEDWN